MKAIEILLRLIDNLLTAIKFRKAQDERDELENNPSAWFAKRFNDGLSATHDKTNKTDSSNNS